MDPTALEAPAQDDATLGYREWAPTYDDPGNPLIALEELAMKPLLDSTPPGDAIDVVAGTGRHARWLAARGHCVVTVDRSVEMLKKLDDTSGVRIVVGDTSMLPLRPTCADLVFCSLALTHVQVGHLGPVVAEFGRVLRPGGRALLSDIHPLVAAGGMAFYRTTAGEGRFVRNHVHWLSDYLAVFAAAGLSVVACEEPRFGPATGVPHLLAAASAEVDEVAQIAFLGLPGVLVWELERK